MKALSLLVCLLAMTSQISAQWVESASGESSLIPDYPLIRFNLASSQLTAGFFQEQSTGLRFGIQAKAALGKGLTPLFERGEFDPTDFAIKGHLGYAKTDLSDLVNAISIQGFVSRSWSKVVFVTTDGGTVVIDTIGFHGWSGGVTVNLMRGGTNTPVYLGLSAELGDRNNTKSLTKGQACTIVSDDGKSSFTTCSEAYYGAYTEDGGLISFNADLLWFPSFLSERTTALHVLYRLTDTRTKKPNTFGIGIQYAATPDLDKPKSGPGFLGGITVEWKGRSVSALSGLRIGISTGISF